MNQVKLNAVCESYLKLHAELQVKKNHQIKLEALKLKATEMRNRKALSFAIYNTVCTETLRHKMELFTYQRMLIDVRFDIMMANLNPRIYRGVNIRVALPPVH